MGYDGLVRYYNINNQKFISFAYNQFKHILSSINKEIIIKNKKVIRIITNEDLEKIENEMPTISLKEISSFETDEFLEKLEYMNKDEALQVKNKIDAYFKRRFDI